MQDLALWNHGDLSELCGVKVKGCGEIFSGEWNSPDKMRFPKVDLSAIPSKSPDEDGVCRLAEIELCGAEPYIWDAAKKAPLVVRYRYGSGMVYLLTAYAYFGHECLQKIMAQLVAKLAAENLPKCRVIAPCGEIFWNMWEESPTVKRLMLLNTDWSTRGNAKTVTVQVPGISFKTEIIERTAKILTITDKAVIEAPLDMYVTAESGKIRIYGNRPDEITLRYYDGKIRRQQIFFADSTEEMFEL
jgi:hypothetical protein